MSGIDYVILGVIALSAALGAWRGFIREAISLIVWLVAFWFAFTWSTTLEVYLGRLIDDYSVRVILTFVVLFLTVHIMGFLASKLMAALIKSTGLRGVDRVAGGGFGLLRGIVLVSVTVLLAELTPMRQELIWQESYLVSIFNDFLHWIRFYYPLDKFGEEIVSQRMNIF